MGTRRIAPLAVPAGVMVVLAALACTCGPLSTCGPLTQLTGIQATVGAAQATVAGAQSTIDAAMEEFGPTIEAGLTEFAPTLIAGATEYGPELQTMEAGAIATAEAFAQTGIPQGTPGAYDGGDGLVTTGGGTLSVGGSAQGTLNSIFEAHNWTFEGQAGQNVTIRVEGQGETDPRAKLLDPEGNVLAEDDDGGGGLNALITYTLPVSGTYTVRVDVFTEGTYTVSVE